jgi:hypothetical protein
MSLPLTCLNRTALQRLDMAGDGGYTCSTGVHIEGTKQGVARKK